MTTTPPAGSTGTTTPPATGGTGTGQAGTGDTGTTSGGIAGSDGTMMDGTMTDGTMMDGTDMGAAGSGADMDGTMMDDTMMDDTDMTDTGGGLPADHCLAGITNYDSDGPFSFSRADSGRIKIWVPDVPAGCKVPVVHVANGTGASCSFYNAAIERMASHGFITACYEDANTGAGEQGLEALMTVVSEHPDKADLRFGSTGHSQGGQASFVVLQYAEEQWGDEGIYAGLAMQPASGFGEQPTGGWQNVYSKIKSPMFMFSGQGSDGLVSQSWVQDAFDALSDDVEAYFWAKSGSSHFSPNGPQMEVSISWFRWKLLGDSMACEYFKTVRDDPSWEEADVQNEAPCM
ncbi:MAG: hypothetical protein PVI30_20540 [Myxococcales bacterium]